MRVAIDGRSLASPGLRGWDRYTVGLIRELNTRGVDVVLLHQPSRRPRPAHLAGLRVTIEQVASPSGLLWEQWALPQAVVRLGCDLYHAPCEHGLPLVCGVPTVLTIHSMTSHSYHELVRTGALDGPVSRYLGYDFSPGEWSLANRYQRWQAKRAGHIITPSRFSGREVVQYLGIPASRVTVTHLGIPADLLEPMDDESAGEVFQRLGVRAPYLLFVGGFEPHKNVDGVLDVFARVRAARPGLQLVLVGSGQVPERLERTLSGRGMTLGHDVLTLVDLGPELRALYRAAACFISLSWRESFGLPALEANVHGTPAVVSRHGASREVLGVGAYLVDPQDVEAAAALVERILQTAARVPEAEIARLIQRFSWTKLGRRTVEVYARLLGDN